MSSREEKLIKIEKLIIIIILFNHYKHQILLQLIQNTLNINHVESSTKKDDKISTLNSLADSS
jgi:hypothetical protein